MTVHSQNGWPAFHTAAEGKFVRFNAGGRGWWAANADAALVAQEFITRFDAEVEHVVQPGETYDDWSFADRLVRGSTADVSNHGSATAWDINSTRHLLGADNTFSDADETRLLAIQRSITDDTGRPVLRWGGSYSGRKDEMHVEINATKAQVKQAADKIRARKEDDVTPAELKAALKSVLEDKSLIDNIDAEGKVTGTMSFVRAHELGDRKLDTIGPLIKLVTALRAEQATTNAAVAQLLTNSPEGVRKAFEDGRAALQQDLSDLDVHVIIGNPSPTTGA